MNPPSEETNIPDVERSMKTSPPTQIETIEEGTLLFLAQHLPNSSPLFIRGPILTDPISIFTTTMSVSTFSSTTSSPVTYTIPGTPRSQQVSSAIETMISFTIGASTSSTIGSIS